MMLSRKTSFKSLTKTPKGGMRLVIRAQRPRVIRKIDTNLSSTGPKEAVFQATRDLGKKKKKAPQPAYLQGKEKMASYWRFC